MLSTHLLRGISITGALLLLASCAAVSHTGPTSGPTAKVRFVASVDELAFVKQYDDTNCQKNERKLVTVREGVLVNSAQARLEIPGSKEFHKNSAQEISVRAGKPTHFMFSGRTSTTSKTFSCAVPFTLDANVGQQLEAHYRFSPVIGCTVTVSEITGGNAEKAERRPVGFFTSIVTPATKGCKANFDNPKLF
ncbi:hypothetical protein ACMG4P_11255 [Pseudovibrio denitrificans]|uniref:hypothetical protein n=1 Tax=Pseudovibrio denitrificans TaxID=258256 RepID=UPI0039BF5F2F